MSQKQWLSDKDVELTLEPHVLPGENSVKAAKLRKITHLFDTREVHAVNTALAAGRPLLVKGEPGVGKSQLAKAAALSLGRAFISQVMDYQTEARDLLWSFDAVRRLADAQVMSVQKPVEGQGPDLDRVRNALDESRYISPGPLWHGFSPSTAADQLRIRDDQEPRSGNAGETEQGVVVLLDEIDKAPSSVPNGLLECLGSRSFKGPQGETICCTGVMPLVILTTNEERALPEAFIRRCVVLRLQLPTDPAELITWLTERGRAHFSDELIEPRVLEKAVSLLIEDREAARSRNLGRPGGAELIDLLRALALMGKDEADRLKLIGKIREFTFQKHLEKIKKGQERSEG